MPGGIGGDVAIVQVRQALVEIVGAIGGTILSRCEAVFRKQFEPRLKTEGDVAVAAQDLGAGVDQKHRDAEEVVPHAIDARRFDRTDGDDELQAAARHHRCRTVRNDELRRRACRYDLGDGDRQSFLTRDPPPVERAFRRLLRCIARLAGSFARFGLKHGLV